MEFMLEQYGLGEGLQGMNDEPLWSGENKDAEI